MHYWSTIHDARNLSTPWDVEREPNGRNHTGEKMLIPVRCFTCNKVIGGHYEEFSERVSKDEDAAAVMDDLGIERYCCRRIYMAHTNLIDDVLPYD